MPQFTQGQRVEVRRGSKHAGERGVIHGYDAKDSRYPYLVKFPQAAGQFCWYAAGELRAVREEVTSQLA